MMMIKDFICNYESTFYDMIFGANKDPVEKSTTQNGEGANPDQRKSVSADLGSKRI